jgi:hypothetical protein
MYFEARSKKITFFAKRKPFESAESRVDKIRPLICSQFHQHFMSSFTTNIFVPKSIKATFKYKKAAHFGKIDTNRLVQSKNVGVIFPRRR